MKNLFFILIIVGLGIFSRFVPHPANITALGATALFAGAYLRPRWLALAAPLLTLMATDAVLGFYPGIGFVYLAWLAVTVIGFFLAEVTQQQGQQTLLTRTTGQKWSIRALAAVVGTSVFYLVSNFGVWYAGGIYPLTGEGLSQCYLAGLPFLARQLAGDLVFTLGLFAAYDLFVAASADVRVTKPQ